MTMSCSVIVFLLVSVVITVDSVTTLSQTAPSYVPVCPGDTVIFTCITHTGSYIWSLNKITGFQFTSSANIGDSNNYLHPFTLTLTNKSGPANQTLVSTASVLNVDYSLNGTNIFCSNNFINTKDTSVLTLEVSDKSPGPPIGLSVTALNDCSVNLTWSPPSLDSICITGYIINTDDIPVTTTSTNTLVLSHLSYGNIYNFTVAAVDKTNTTGNFSQHVIINLSVPNEVRNLNYTSTGDGSITVYWNSPVNNYHPDIIYYIIYTNMTDTSHVTITSDLTNNYTLNCGAPAGSIYFISVSAVNIVGEGTNYTIYVSLVDDSPTPPSSAVYTTVSLCNSIPIIGSSSGNIHINKTSHFHMTSDQTLIKTLLTSKIITQTCSTCDDFSTRSPTMSAITTHPMTPIPPSLLAIIVSIGALISVLLTVAISVFIGCCIVQLIMRKKRYSTKDEGQLNLVINHVHVHDEPQLQIVNAIYERTSNTQSYYNSTRN